MNLLKTNLTKVNDFIRERQPVKTSANQTTRELCCLLTFKRNVKKKVGIIDKTRTFNSNSSRCIFELNTICQQMEHHIIGVAAEAV